MVKLRTVKKLSTTLYSVHMHGQLEQMNPNPNLVCMTNSATGKW